RIRRDGNLAAPPLELSRILQQPAKDLVTSVFSPGGPAGASSLEKVVEGVVDAALAKLGNFDFGPARVHVQGFFSDRALASGAPDSWLDYLYVTTDEEFKRLRGDTAKWGYGYSGERFQGLVSSVPGAVKIFRKVRKPDKLVDGWADHFYTQDENEAKD